MYNISSELSREYCKPQYFNTSDTSIQYTQNSLVAICQFATTSSFAVKCLLEYWIIQYYFRNLHAKHPKQFSGNFQFATARSFAVKHLLEYWIIRQEGEEGECCGWETQWGGIRTRENSGFHPRGCQMIVLYSNRTAKWDFLHFGSNKIFLWLLEKIIFWYIFRKNAYFT